MNVVHRLVAIMRFRSNRFRTMVVHGVGTAGMWQAWDTVRLLWEHGVLNELVGAILANAHREVLDLRASEVFRKISRYLAIRAPRQMLDSHPDGLLGNPAEGELTEVEWWPLIGDWWAMMSSLAARFRGTVGLVVHFLSSGGGHLYITVKSVDHARKVFRGLHLGVFFITEDTRLLRNLLLAEYLGYPDSLGIPLLVLKDAVVNRWVVPTLLMLLTAAGRIRRTGQRRAVELFARLIDESPVIVLAAAWRDVPVIPLNLLQKTWRWFRRLSVDVVRESMLVAALADAIAEVCESNALYFERVTAPRPDAVQAIVGGGITADMRHMVMTEGDQRLLADALTKAKAMLKEGGAEFPRGAEHNLVFAPHFIESDKHGHVRVAVIRLVPLKSVRARQLVDAVLREKGLLGQDGMDGGGRVAVIVSSEGHMPTTPAQRDAAGGA